MTHGRGWVIEYQRRIEDNYLCHCANPMLYCIGCRYHDWQYVAHQLPATAKASRQYYLAQDTIPGISPCFCHSHGGGHPGIYGCLCCTLQMNFTNWFKCYALTIMIVELGVQIVGPTVERLWTLVSVAFEETAHHVADSDRGRLWCPIKKMMNKAQAVRKTQLKGTAANLGSLLHGGAPTLAIPTVPWRHTRTHVCA